MSNHDFQTTPAQEEIIARLRRMQELGADSPKIVVMPFSRRKTLTLLSATLVMKEMVRHPPVNHDVDGANKLASAGHRRLFGPKDDVWQSVGRHRHPDKLAVRQLREMMNILS